MGNRATNNVTPMPGTRGSALRAVARAPGIPRVYLLGPMRAVGPAGNDILPRARKAQAVLAYLCLAQGERVPRGRLAGIIWDRAGEIQARDSLRHALSELERIGSWRLWTDRETVRLDISDCWVDAFESPEASDQLLDGLDEISPAFDQWLLGERARFENRWQAKLETELNELVTSDAPPEQRAAAARRLLNFMPTHEPAVRCAMKAFAEMDDPAQVVREFERFRQAAEISLGIPPSEKTTVLYSALRMASQTRSVRPSSRVISRLGGEEIASTARATHEERGPSIAVLPLQDLSTETSQYSLAEGLVWDLVEALSRSPTLFVSSRLSAAAFKNQNRLPQEIGEALGVRYLLLGSLRDSGRRLRLAIELTDSESGASLGNWRFDEESADLLDVQDRLTNNVLRSIAPHLRTAELQRVRIKRPEVYSAYDFFLRGQDCMHSSDPAQFDKAGELFEKSIGRDPHYATALAWLAHWHVLRVGQGRSRDRIADTGLAKRYAQQAIDRDELEPMAFAVRGHVAAYLDKDFDLASDCFAKALEINPNNPRAWLWSAAVHAWSGEGAEAVQKINQAMALSPFDPLTFAYSGIASMAYLADGQYERAVEFALRCKRDNRGYTHAYRALIFALVRAGRENEARTPANQLLQLDPTFTVRRFRQQSPVCAGPIGAVYCDALARAGIPL
jgi:TolB-like protein